MANEREIATVVERVLNPLFDALSGRDAKNASRTAGKLTFWRDGMLCDLEDIAAGNHDHKTVASLKKKLEDSAPRVRRAMNELRRLRDRLAPSKVAEQIDIVLHHDTFGKGSIRDSIEMILRGIEPDGNNDDAAEFAQKLCERIRTLNAELRKLSRMVHC